MNEIKTYLTLNQHLLCNHYELIQITDCLNYLINHSTQRDPETQLLVIPRYYINEAVKIYSTKIVSRARDLAYKKGI